MSTARAKKPHPIWRCGACNHWQHRNGETVGPACPWCAPAYNGASHKAKRVQMFATVRAEPVPSAAWGSAFEDI